MKISSILRIILLVVGMHAIAAQGQLDTMWLCRDSHPEALWLELGLADTFPDNRGAFEMVDTGASLNESPYVNFDYQFGNPNPGYAGFKFFWDNGIMQFYVAKYDSMILWHKGPLPGHKVKMVWAQGSAGCGTPINYQTFGEFKSSTEWKRESFGFPAKRGDVSTYPDSPFVKDGLFELRMLIYNDEGTTSETSDPGCLKIDNMFFKKNTAGTKSIIVPAKITDANHFIPNVSDKVTLSIFSLQGEQLFRESVDVTAGKTYKVIPFARKHSNLPAKWVQCVHIFGAGVNVSKKVIYK